MAFIDQLTSGGVFPEPFETFEEGIDKVLPYIERVSDELTDTDVYTDQRWVEVRDDVDFQESVLHVFKEDGSYMRIIEGNIEIGSWSYDVNGIILKYQSIHAFYEPVFIDDDFFILRKHGSNAVNKRRYLFFTTESNQKKYTWAELITVLYRDFYRQNHHIVIIVMVLFAIALAILYFSM